MLRRLPGLACFGARGLLVSHAATGLVLRDPRNTSGMPDVEIRIESDGFYVLDNNAELANDVLAELVRYMLGTCASVTIEEP